MKKYRKNILSISAIALFMAGIVLSFFNPALSLITGVSGLLLAGFNTFEKSSVSAERMVLVAILSAISAAGRILFVSIPGMNPSSFIIIISGIVFGPSFGFMTGALTALVSNMVMGHGPWTIWQMALWGLMGVLSGFLSKPLMKYKWFICTYSFLWGFVFGWIMNIYHVMSGFVTEPGLKAFLVACAASFTFDLLHAAGNLVLVLVFSSSFIKIFERAALKYGLKE